MKNKFLALWIAIITAFPSIAFSQWSNKWSSSDINSTNASGWINFQKDGNNWINKFYTIDATSIKIMNGQFSETPLYTYTFTAEEQTAGNQIYSVGKDLTGDGIVEFYVLGYSGSSDNYRESFKIIDITTGSTIFEKNDPNYYYSYPVIWDVDNDGTLDCTFTQYDYPNYTSYSYQVYNTGVATSISQSHVVNLNFKLKQNYPNPFNPSTTITYSLNKAGNVNIDIFDIYGKLVNHLFSGFKSPGNHQVIWDGRNSSGNKIASGTYFYQINFDGNKRTKKMMLLK